MDSISSDELRALSQISAWRNVVAISISLAGLAAAFLATLRWPYAWVMILAGIWIAREQFRLAVLSHEAVHFRLFRRRSINDFVGSAISAPLFFPFATYRGIHLEHHKNPLHATDPALPMTGTYPKTRSAFAGLVKTALLFPGLDALFNSANLRRWLSNETVLGSLDEASAHLACETRQPENLGAFLRERPRPHVADFDRTLIALTGLQIGIARALEGEKIDVVAGCSHGDIARSVHCGILDYPSAVEALWAFASYRASCTGGCTANVRTLDARPMSPEHFAWLRQEGVPFSRWSESSGTIAGTTERIKHLASLSRARGLKIKPALPYPVPSEVMRPGADVLRQVASQWSLGQSRFPVFSSVWLRYLRDENEALDEAVAGTVSPVHWLEALELLHRREGVTRFLNVGPSNSLTRWIETSAIFGTLTLDESWDVLHGVCVS